MRSHLCSLRCSAGLTSAVLKLRVCESACLPCQPVHWPARDPMASSHRTKPSYEVRHQDNASSSSSAPQQPSAASSARYAGGPRRQASNASTQSGTARQAGQRAAASGSSGANHVETMTTKLLVETKKLLEGLTQWSNREASEEDISNSFVRLGNLFVRHRPVGSDNAHRTRPVRHSPRRASR